MTDSITRHIRRQIAEDMAEAADYMDAMADDFERDNEPDKARTLRAAAQIIAEHITELTKETTDEA